VHFLLALHNQTVFDKFADKDSGVGLANLLNLIGVNPNTLSSTLENRSSEALLTLKTHHNL
jgi:hypothetical protein